MRMVPALKPRMGYAEVAAKADALGLDRAKHPFFIVGIRGYYRDTMGAPGVQERGIYDDAIFLVSPLAFASFNGNTDPSRVRKGTGFGAGKGMAVLKPGLWMAHRFGVHKAGRPTAHEALVQSAGDVTVIRDGNPPYPETGRFGINIHRGGVNSTSSEGCQTIPPAQWAAFIAMAHDLGRRHFGAAWRSTTIPYLLLEA